jgi:hypothetical protein
MNQHRFTFGKNMDTSLLKRSGGIFIMPND